MITPRWGYERYYGYVNTPGFGPGLMIWHPVGVRKVREFQFNQENPKILQILIGFASINTVRQCVYILLTNMLKRNLKHPSYRLRRAP